MRLLKKIESLLANESLRKGSLFSLFSFFNNGVNFLLLLVLASYILPSDYGYLNLFATIIMVLSYFKAMSTEGYFSIAYFKEGPVGLKKTFSNVIGLSAAFLIILTGILSGFGEYASKGLDLPITLLYMAVIIVFFNLYENLFLDYLRVQEKIKAYGIFACSKAILLFLIAIALVKGIQLGWKGQAYAQLGCAVAFGTFGLICLVYKVHLTKIDWAYCKKMLLWGIPLIPHLSINFIRQGFDRYIINFHHGIESVGIFSLALNLTNVIFIIGTGFNQSNSVEIFKLLGNANIPYEEKIKLLRKQRHFLLKILTVTAIAFSGACYIAIPILLPNYIDSLKYFPLLALYAYFYCCYFLYTNYLFFFKRTKSLMYVTFSSSLLHLGLSLVLTKYSMYCTCAIYCISQGLILLGVRYLALKTLKEHSVESCSN